MDDRRFDGLARSLASAPSRRTLLKGLFGAGVLATLAGERFEADAARRGFSGPRIPPFGCQPQCNGNTCGSNGCGGTCACRGSCFCLAQAASAFPNVSSICVAAWIVPNGNHCAVNSDCAFAGTGLVCDAPSGICFQPCFS